VLTDLSLTPDQLGQDWQTLARSPLPFETSHPGLFAVGDLRSGSTKRVAAAVGEGSARCDPYTSTSPSDHARRHALSPTVDRFQQEVQR
jgi:hypothetical protein